MPSRLRFAAVLLAVPALIGTAPLVDAQKRKKQIEEEKKPWWDAPQPRFSRSELGHVFTGTIDMRGKAPVKDRTIYKAIAVRLGKEGKDGTAIFDTEMCRLACAVPDRPVMFNTYRDGLGGAGHWVGSPYLMSAPGGPGWANADGSFEDPRLGRKAGPLPKDWAQFQGHYRHGDDVIFSYTVGGVEVLESPRINKRPSKTFIILERHFLVGPSPAPMSLRLCHAGENTRVIVIDDEITLAPEEVDGVWTLTVPPREKPLAFAVSILTAPNPEEFTFSRFAAHPTVLSRVNGGPGRYPKPFVTEGILGKEKGPYVVDTLTPPFENPEKILFRFGGHDFFSNGDIATCTIDGDVWRVSGVDDTLGKLTWKRFATGLFQPLGLRVVDDKVYVLGRDQITRLHDFNNDHEADFYECFNNQCKIGNHVHEFATGLETDPEGNFYFVKGHGAGNDHAGTLLKVSKDGSSLDVVATGFRWPNGSGAGPNGELTVADQQGTWVPSSRLDLIKPGGFYGFMNTHHRETKPETYDGPLCWIPHSVDNSCGGQTWNTGDKWGPFQGHMVHLSYGKCRLFLVLQENIDGTDQAGIFQFPVRFQSGAMRARFSPHDGQLYVSGLKGWQTSAAKDGCLQRVRYTGKPVAMPKSLHVHKNGIRVGFTQELDRELAEDLDSWQIEQWNYRWTNKYGSKDYKISNPDQTGHDPVPIQSATLLANRREVFLAIEDLAPVMQMKIHFDLETKGGQELIGDLHNTIHALRDPFELE